MIPCSAPALEELDIKCLQGPDLASSLAIESWQPSLEGPNSSASAPFQGLKRLLSAGTLGHACANDP